MMLNTLLILAVSLVTVHGMRITVRHQEERGPVDVNPEATVLDLHIEMASIGVDLKDRTLIFRGQKLTDPETLLANKGMNADVDNEVSVSEVLEQTVEGVLGHLDILDCIDALNAASLELEELPMTEAADFVELGLTSKQARILVFYFQKPVCRLLARGGMTAATEDVSMGLELYLRGEVTGALEVPPGATVAHLLAAAATSGIDMSNKKLKFQGASLSDRSASLSDIGVCPEAFIDVSPVVWNIGMLPQLEPIFEAEFVVPGGENKIVFLIMKSIDGMSRRSTMKPIFRNGYGEWVDEPSQWSQDQQAAIDDLAESGVVNFGRSRLWIYEKTVDLPNHIWGTDSDQDFDDLLPLQCELPGSEGGPFVLKTIADIK